MTGQRRVGLEESFFDLDNYSLLATELISGLEKDFGVNLNLEKVLREPTVRGMAASILDELSRNKGKH